jgi:methyltransferase-like protein/trans-aconitate methyltransferase
MTTYDQTPYASYPYAQTHPDRLAVIAAVHGLASADVRRARVLELGCCSGGNLIPMAEQLPDATFVGLDASSRQIADGQRTVERLGLSNINLLTMDILDVGKDLGEFDYILCHGVYSWVPRNVQDKILTICRDNLAKNGVAYVSYNTLPGWRMRGVIRDIMLYRARGFDQPQERINRARSLVDFLARSVPGEQNAYGMLLRREMEMLQNKEDSYLLHEHLEDHNEAVYFSEFADRARVAGLQYLAEADYGSTSLTNAPEQVRTVIESIAGDEIEVQQYLDFLRNRMFRQTLLTHADATIDRTPRGERLHGLYLSSQVRPEGEIGELNNGQPVKFRGPHAVTTTTNPLMKACLLHLGSIWPRSIRFTELLAAARSTLHTGTVVVGTRESAMSDTVADPLLRCYTTGQVELSTTPNRYALSVSETPQASPYARLQAESGHVVTNCRHENTRLSDLDRTLLKHLDGTKGQDELLEAVTDAAVAGEVVVQNADEVVLDRDRLTELLRDPVRTAVDRLARSAFLIG